MSRYRFKVSPKPKVLEMIEKYGHGLFLEINHQSKPCYHLRTNTQKGLITVARVSKSFLKWFPDLKEIETPFINISRWEINPKPTDKRIKVNRILNTLNLMMERYFDEHGQINIDWSKRYDRIAAYGLVLNGLNPEDYKP